MNLKINILTKNRFTNLDIFLYYYKFHKITNTVLTAVVEEATKFFSMSLNRENCILHNSFDHSVFLFQEEFKCIENQKQICYL